MTAKKAKAVKRKTTARKSSKAAKRTSSKMTASQKHTAHVKHEEHLAHEAHLTAVGKAPKAALAKPGDFLPVCAFEAIAQSLRLAGQFVHDDDVAHLWWLAGADPLGATLAAALDAASLHGLAGFRPRWERLERLGPVRLADEFRLPRRDDPALSLDPFEHFLAGDAHALILGIDAPGPHAVLATPDGWWSWGELHDPWPCRVDQAWAVSWS